jgi:hypothetical protein
LVGYAGQIDNAVGAGAVDGTVEKERAANLKPQRTVGQTLGYQADDRMGGRGGNQVFIDALAIQNDVCAVVGDPRHRVQVIGQHSGNAACGAACGDDDGVSGLAPVVQGGQRARRDCRVTAQQRVVQV